MPSQGRYSGAKLIAKHGRKGNMSAWVSNRKVTARSATPSGSKTAATLCARSRYCEKDQFELNLGIKTPRALSF